MAWEEFASGTNINDIAGYESQVPEETRAMLELQCKVPVPSTNISWLRNSLSWAGIQDLNVSSSGSIIRITYRKGAFWIPLIISLIIVLAIVIIVWRFYREVADVIGPIPATALLIGGAVLAGIIAYKIIRSRRAEGK